MAPIYGVFSVDLKIQFSKILIKFGDVMAFKIKNREEVYKEIYDEVQNKYKDYKIDINLDIDVSD